MPQVAFRTVYPSGSCVAFELPIPRSRICWIDAGCKDLARKIIRQFEAGELTEGEADSALHALRYGRP